MYSYYPGMKETSADLVYQNSCNTFDNILMTSLVVKSHIWDLEERIFNKLRVRPYEKSAYLWSVYCKGYYLVRLYSNLAQLNFLKMGWIKMWILLFDLALNNILERTTKISADLKEERLGVFSTVSLIWTNSRRDFQNS